MQADLSCLKISSPKQFLKIFEQYLLFLNLLTQGSF